MRILYRGPLASCNYDCPYCPFAKRRDPPELLRQDRADLARFVAWVEEQDRPIEILFTPWGEGLTRSWYRDALTRLSHLRHVHRVAIQTNIAGRLDWVADADKDTLALWCTYHPGQVTPERFLARCGILDRNGVRYSVGVVGLPEHHEAAVAMRAALPPEVYLWVNAAEGHTYTGSEIERWTLLDPLFGFSVHPHESLGMDCRTGDEVISVLGDGTVRRCHFVTEALGNLYDGSWRPERRPCPNTVCDCHIGYVHLETLPLYEVFAGGILERIPHRDQLTRARACGPNAPGPSGPASPCGCAPPSG